jgi:2-methylisocitrate lyase-like PEP mutase family enzyme
MTTNTASPSAHLRQLLAKDGVLQVPGIYDGLTARLAAMAAFDAVAITGNALSASVLGAADVGLATLSEVVTAARNIANAVDVPVIADADTGYGNALNVTRAIRELERAGVAGVHMEDQITPKRCGLVDTPIPVIESDEFVGKLEAALWARRDPDFVLIARTDAMASLGLDEAIRRANVYLAAGADVAMVVGPSSIEHVTRVCQEVQGPVAIVVDERGATGALSRKELSHIGVKLALYAGAVRYTVVEAVQRTLAALHRDGSSLGYRDAMATFQEWNRVVGFADYVELERRFVRSAPSGDQRVEGSA